LRAREFPGAGRASTKDPAGHQQHDTRATTTPLPPPTPSSPPLPPPANPTLCSREPLNLPSSEEPVSRSHNVCFHRGECKPIRAIASAAPAKHARNCNACSKANIPLTIHVSGPPLGRSRLRCLLRLLTPGCYHHQGQDRGLKARVRAQGEAHQRGKGCLGTEERA
jgi:hypothetical protein